MNIPNKISIGFRTFDVVMQDNLNSMGTISNSKRLIQLESSQCKEDMLDTIIHECLHAIVSDSQLVDDCDEEKLVTVLAYKLTELFLRNPELVNWINQTIEEKE